MRQAIKWITILIISATLFLLPMNDTMAYDPPGPPGEHGQSGDQEPGGGAPISGGLPLLIVLGTGYGLTKYYMKDMEGAIEE